MKVVELDAGIGSTAGWVEMEKSAEPLMATKGLPVRSRAPAPVFSIVKVRVMTPLPVTAEPKSVSSVGLGVLSPLAMLVELPSKLISGAEPVVTENVVVPGIVSPNASSTDQSEVVETVAEVHSLFRSCNNEHDLTQRHRLLGLNPANEVIAID